MILKRHTNFLCLLFFIGCIHTTLRAQILMNQHYLSNDIESLINSNPDQALKIAQHLLSKTTITNSEKAKINLLIAKAYKVKGDYSSALNFLFEEKNYSDYLTVKEKIAIEIEKIAILRELALDKQSKKIMTSLEHTTAVLSDASLKRYAEVCISLEKAHFLLKENQLDSGIKMLIDLENSSESVFKSYPDLELYYDITLGSFYLEKRDLEKSKKFFDLAIGSANKQKDVNVLIKVESLIGLATISFQKKEHRNGIIILNEALLNSQKLANIFLQETIIGQQNVNYLALNDTENYKITNASFIKKHFDLEELEQEAVNTAYNVISEEYNDKYDEKRSHYTKMLYYILGVFFIILLVCGFYVLRFIERKRNLNKIISYIKITRSNLLSDFSEKTQEKLVTTEKVEKTETKKVFILKETEEQILNKLKRFENSKRFLNKDISLAVLAGQLDSNTKYLSEIINSHYNVNFNTYINRLRINYIIEKLKNDPNYINYKISYLADNCGFSSHSSFATVFKSITGISPVKFIELLNDEKENTLLNDKY